MFCYNSLGVGNNISVQREAEERSKRGEHTSMEWVWKARKSLTEVEGVNAAKIETRKITNNK